jgi:hypothetical protein
MFRLFFAIFRFVVTVAAASYATVNYGILIGAAALIGALIGCLILQVSLAYFLFAPLSSRNDARAMADKDMSTPTASFNQAPFGFPAICEKYADLRLSTEDLTLISIMSLTGWSESERTAESLVLSNGIQTKVFKVGSGNE